MYNWNTLKFKQGKQHFLVAKTFHVTWFMLSLKHTLHKYVNAKLHSFKMYQTTTIVKLSLHRDGCWSEEDNLP